MSIAGLLLRFTALYLGLTLAAAAAFYLLGAKMNSGVNIGVLFGAVFGSCAWFTSRNKRAMEPAEKRSAFLGMWAVDTLLQGAAIALFAGTALPSNATALLLGSLAFVALLHGIGIYAMVAMAARTYAKQVAKQAAKSA